MLGHPEPSASVQDAIHFTYDDHQAGTAMQEAPGQPNRIRAIRTAEATYGIYFDPRGEEPNEHELYDLDRDPLEVDNLIGVRSGVVRDVAAAALHRDLVERLRAEMTRCGTADGVPPG